MATPTGNFTYKQTSNIAPYDVFFSATGSVDDGVILLYDWDFGDGDLNTSVFSTITHEYSTSGNFDVSLIVTDNEGLSSSVSAVVSITAPEVSIQSTYESPFVYPRYNYDIGLFAKDVIYSNNPIELRQINVYPTSASITNVDLYTVSGQNQDWTTAYYNLTSFPYSVIVLPEVYDNVIQGFTQLYVETVSGTLYDISKYDIQTLDGFYSYDDKYMLNSFRDKTTRLANLFMVSTSITSSITSEYDKNYSFIDYQNGIIIMQPGINNINYLVYSSGVQIRDNQFLCIANENEFNDTTNPSAKNASGTGYLDEFVSPYITGVGIYDDDGDLLVVAKLTNPIRKSNKISTVFKLQLDM